MFSKPSSYVITINTYNGDNEQNLYINLDKLAVMPNFHALIYPNWRKTCSCILCLSYICIALIACINREFKVIL